MKFFTKNSKTIFLGILFGLLFLAPFIVSAATGVTTSCSTTFRTFSDVVCFFLDLIQTLIPVVFGLMLLVFFWGLAKMILNAGDESAQEEGKHLMIWGVIGLFVAVSVYGIVSFLYSSSGFSEPLSFPPQIHHF